MAGSEFFFERLNRWFAEAGEAHPWMKSFESLSEAGILNAEAFYVQWLDFILPGLDIPVGCFSSRAELKNIYRLFDCVDPLYYRSDEIRSIISECPVLNKDQIDVLTSKISAFLHLLGTTGLNRVQLESHRFLGEWWVIFLKTKPKTLWSGCNRLG